MTITHHVHGSYQWAHADPDRIALVSGTRTRTFGELGSRVNRLSHAWRAHGIGPGDIVASLVSNGIEYVEIALSTAQIGAIFLPLNHTLASETLHYILADSEARAVVADAAVVDHLGEYTPPETALVLGPERPGWGAFARFATQFPDTDPPDRRAGTTSGYTSGTTGRPKGVRRDPPETDPETELQSFRGLLARFGLIGPDGVHLTCSPLYHSAPSSFALGTLHLGHTLIMHERFNAEATLRDIERYSITNTHLVPTHLHRLLSLDPELRSRYDLSSLTTLVHAGAPCPREVKDAMIAWLGPVLWEYLGATEGLVAIASPADWAAHPGTVGRPTAPGNVHILDAEHHRVPPEVDGEIYFRPSREFHYHNDPQKTDSGRHEDLVTVGDIGHFDDQGYLYLRDRRTDLIVSGGVNVYPAEIEAVLLSHPAVCDVGVIGIPDPEWGQIVVAALALDPKRPRTEALRREIAEFGRDRLSAAQRPKRIEFLEDFPRTPAGKLLRSQLRERYLTPARLTH